MAAADSPTPFSVTSSRAIAVSIARLLRSNQNTYLSEIEAILGGRTVFVKSDPLLHQEKFDLA